MVKGVTKQVVVVRCPDTKFFDQAIFMVRDDFLTGVDSEKILKEACRAADGYIRENVEHKSHRWRFVVPALAAAGTVAALVLLFLL